MNRGLTMLTLCAAFLGAACSSNSTYDGGARAQGVDPSGHRLVQCERYAPTGSRIKNHVDCDSGQKSDGYELRTWQDIEKDRAN